MPEYNKPQTKTLGVEPKRKETEKATHGSRVVLVCPYQNYIDYIGPRLHDLIPGTEVEVISKVDSYGDRHGEVLKKECGVPEPFLVIDFKKVIAPVVKPVVNASKMLKLREAYVKTVFDNLKQEILNFEGFNCLDETYDDSTIKNLIKSTALAGKLKNAWEDARRDAFEEKPVLDVVDFLAYAIWAQEHKKVRYFAVNTSFAAELQRLQKYQDGEFIPASVVVVEPYASQLDSDLEAMVKGKKNRLYFFD